ncbi:hypothetical protein QR97_39720 [Streptomyces sp. PBH53]|nr:hypothetical protein QR97_39720 [Streptomyces sp. PBH53]
MPDELHARYQAAFDAWQAHVTSCDRCTPDSPAADCPVGRRLHTSFERLQDAYLTRLEQRRRR